MMIPRPEQIEMADAVEQLLRKYAIAVLAAEERTGKTLASIVAIERLPVFNVLVLTTKKALSGWDSTLRNYTHEHIYTVTNYHQAHKYANFNYDLVVLDECHNYLTAYPKPSQMWKEIRQITLGKPILYMSATPHAQGYAMLYHLFKLSSFGPWNNYTNFYSWHKAYGIPYSLEINGIAIPQYDKVQPVVKEVVEHLFYTKTRAELGFEFEPEDVLHYIEPSEYLKAAYNQLQKHKIIYTDFCKEPLVCDTQSKLRAALHMLEGGTCKIGKIAYQCKNREKIDYILEHWGDTEDLVIMYNYIEEFNKLSAVFKKAKILHGTSNAEGVELAEYRHLVIYSQDWRTAKHTQRRARQASKARTEDIKVHFLLIKNAITSAALCSNCCCTYLTRVWKGRVNIVALRHSKE